MSHGLIATVIIFFVAIAGVVFINMNSLGMPTGKSVASSESYCEEVQVPYTDVEVFTEVMPMQDCEERKLDYSAGDFEIISECIKFDEEKFCVNKNVYFFLNIRNLDNLQGVWKTKFVLYGDEKELFSKSQMIQLGPEEGSKIAVTFSLDGKENSNKIISGEYKMEREATNKICSGPITYKNVSNTVSVTKFRTEVKCF